MPSMTLKIAVFAPMRNGQSGHHDHGKHGRAQQPAKGCISASPWNLLRFVFEKRSIDCAQVGRHSKCLRLFLVMRAERPAFAH